MNHIDAIELRLSNERARLVNAETQNERELRAAWIAQIEKELADEQAFIGKTTELPEMSDEEILAALS